MGKKRMSDKDANDLIAKLEGLYTPGDFLTAWERENGDGDFVFSSYVFVSSYDGLPDLFQIERLGDALRYTEVKALSDVKKAEVLCTVIIIELLNMVLYTNSENTEGGFELEVLNKLYASLVRRHDYVINSIKGVLPENAVPPTDTLYDTVDDILLVLSNNGIESPTDPDTRNAQMFA